jgi:hypothetical protein
MVRGIVGCVTGIVVAMLIVTGFDMLSHLVYSPPAGVDWNDRAAAAQAIASTPFAALAVLSAGWFLAPFLGGMAATVIARTPLAGWIVASVLLAATVANLILLPHPPWMVYAGFVLPTLGAVMARLLAPAGD